MTGSRREWLERIKEENDGDESMGRREEERRKRQVGPLQAQMRVTAREDERVTEVGGRSRKK